MEIFNYPHSLVCILHIVIHIACLYGKSPKPGCLDVGMDTKCCKMYFLHFQSRLESYLKREKDLNPMIRALRALLR